MVWFGINAFTLCACFLIFIFRMTSSTLHTIKVWTFNCIHYLLLISNIFRIPEIFVVQYQYSNFNFIQTSKLVAIVLYFLLNFYFILSVEAYIRKIKKRSGMAGEIMLAGTVTFKWQLITILFVDASPTVNYT